MSQLGAQGSGYLHVANILGIDPGSRKTGFGIINYVSGRSEYVTSGVIRLPDGELAPRLRSSTTAYPSWWRLHCPQELAIEQVFMATQRRVCLKAGTGRGLPLSPASPGICLSPSTPRGRSSSRWWEPGRRTSRRCSIWLKSCLNLPRNPRKMRPMRSAAALCHAHTQQSMINMAGAKSVRRRRIRVAGMIGRIRGQPGPQATAGSSWSRSEVLATSFRFP